MEIFETSGYPQLLRIIRYVRSRWRIRNTVKGIAYLLLFGLVAFAISAYGMEYFRYSAWSVRLFRIFTYLALVGLALRFLVRPLAKRVTHEQVALYIEEHDPSLKEALSSALEVGGLGDGENEKKSFGASVSPALIEKLVEQTVERCESIDYGHTIEQGGLKRSSAVFFAVAVGGMIAVLLSPSFLRYGAGLLLNPMRSAQAASPYMIVVEPGDIGVARGADQLVTAELQGFDAEESDIAVKSEGEDAWRRLPMSFDDETGRYSFMLFDLEDPTEYYIEAHGVRSDLFRVDRPARTERKLPRPTHSARRWRVFVSRLPRRCVPRHLKMVSSRPTSTRRRTCSSKTSSTNRMTRPATQFRGDRAAGQSAATTE